MAKLKLTADEQQIVKACLEREVFRIARLTKKERELRSNQIAGKLLKKVNEAGDTEATFDRTDLRVLEQIVNAYTLLIRTVTIPEYDRRISTYPEFAIKYNEYLLKEETKLDAAEKLMAKVEKGLK